MNGHEIALVSLSVTILVLLVTTTWRISALSTRVSSAIDTLEKKDKELEEDIKSVREIPVIVNRIGMLENNLTNIPGRVTVLEQVAQFSKEQKAQFSTEIRKMRQSNPDRNKDDK